MVNPRLLGEAIAAKIGQIPEVARALQGSQNSSFYQDAYPSRNSLARAVRDMAPGSVLVAWSATTMATTEAMNQWSHRFLVYVRGSKNDSCLDLLHAIIDGTPSTNAGLKFRHAPVVDYTLSPHVDEANRLTDSEGVDYFEIQISIEETGD